MVWRPLDLCVFCAKPTFLRLNIYTLLQKNYCKCFFFFKVFLWGLLCCCHRTASLFLLSKKKHYCKFLRCSCTKRLLCCHGTEGLSLLPGNPLSLPHPCCRCLAPPPRLVSLVRPGAASFSALTPWSITPAPGSPSVSAALLAARTARPTVLTPAQTWQ